LRPLHEQEEEEEGFYKFLPANTAVMNRKKKKKKYFTCFGQTTRPIMQQGLMTLHHVISLQQ